MMMKPKYQMQETTYVAYNVYEVDDDVKDGSTLYSGGLTTVENFESGAFQSVIGEPTDVVEVLYTFTAATWEEAKSIFNLRQYGEGYNITGDSAVCPKCKSFFYFPLSSGDCALCGKIC